MSGTSASTDSQPDPVGGDDGDLAAVATDDAVVRHDPLARLEAVEASMPARGGRAGRSGRDGRPARRRRFDLKLLLASFGIAVGVVLVVLGVARSVTGREQQGLPDAIESIDPVREATQVPQQTRVQVDLVVGYEASMFIDGVELPTVSLDDVNQAAPGLGEGEQVEIPPGALWEPGNATLTFEPGTSQAIESFTTGEHQVLVRYWRTIDGPATYRTFIWSFYAV
ncbi:MAG: hypothetical protein U0Q03_10820 [Acidimicrobiales bacterium]